MIRVTATFVALSLAVGTAGLAGAARPRPERGAKLAVIDSKPLVLRGSRFLPAEKVRLTVLAGGNRWVRRMTASQTGTFTQRFLPVTVDRCERLIAVAVGSRGSRASIKPFQPACPAP